MKADDLPLSLRRHPEAPEIILECLRTGTFLSTACAYAGVSVAMVKTWIEHGSHLVGQMEDEPFEPTPAQERLMEIALEISRAEAFAEKTLVGVVTDAAVEDGDWRAAMSLLQHRFKERWRPSKEIEYAGNLDISIADRHQTANDMLAALGNKLKALEAAPATETVEVEVMREAQ